MVDQILIDESLVRQTQKLFNNKIQVLELMLEFNIINSHTASYYLLMKLQLLKNNPSHADLNSVSFGQKEGTQRNNNQSMVSSNSKEVEDIPGAEEIANIFLNKYRLDNINQAKTITFSKEKLLGFKSFSK